MSTKKIQANLSYGIRGQDGGKRKREWEEEVLTGKGHRRTSGQLPVSTYDYLCDVHYALQTDF